jgi:hypothetical protein
VKLRVTLLKLLKHTVSSLAELSVSVKLVICVTKIEFKRVCVMSPIKKMMATTCVGIGTVKIVPRQNYFVLFSQQRMHTQVHVSYLLKYVSYGNVSCRNKRF